MAAKTQVPVGLTSARRPLLLGADAEPFDTLGRTAPFPTKFVKKVLSDHLCFKLKQ